MWPRRRHEQRADDPSAWPSRPGVEGDAHAAAIVDRIDQVDWDSRTHAYGPAGDVGPQLRTLVLGDEPARRAAWYELWGNVHHQGTVYDATIPALEVIADLAAWEDFPDQRQAVTMLAAFAEGDGSHAETVAAAVRTRAEVLLRGWRDQPPLVQRALLMLGRSVGVDTEGLRDAVLPERYAPAWAHGTAGDIWKRFEEDGSVPANRKDSCDAAMDALSELEAWAFSETELPGSGGA